MRLRHLILILLATTTLWLPAAASADEDKHFDFELGGYYRLRLFLFQDLSPLARDGEITDTPTQGFWIHRARLRPKVVLGERFTFNLTVNLLDNAVGGDNPELPGANVSEFFSGSILPNPDYRRSVNVERVWGELLSPIGILRFGRMGSNWGLGLLANDGDGEGDDFGDTVDRIMLVTQVGPILIIPAVDKVSETGGFLDAAQNGTPPPIPDFFGNPASTGGQNDDVEEYILAIVHRPSGDSPIPTLGAYSVLRRQVATRSQVFIADAWIKGTVGDFRYELEALTLNGKTESIVLLPGKITAAQYAGVLETGYKWNALDFGLDAGMASGDDASGAGDHDLNNYQFDRDYRVAFLMFNYLVPDPTATVRTFSNGWFVRPNATYHMHLPLFSTFDLKAQVVYAQALAPASLYGADPYGTEVDVTWTAGFYDDRAEWSLLYAALFPGKVWEDANPVTTAEDVIHGVQGRFLIRF